MNYLELVFEIIGAVGSISTAISVIILLFKFRKKLKITCTFPLKNSGIFLITIYNNTMYDNEIKSICFSKGNQKNIWKQSNMFFYVNFNDYSLEINQHTKNLIVHKESYIEIPISHKCIACNYETVGEMFGKPFEKIYVCVTDKNGHKYYLKTGVNIEYFRKISKYDTTKKN